MSLNKFSTEDAGEALSTLRSGKYLTQKKTQDIENTSLSPRFDEGAEISCPIFDAFHSVNNDINIIQMTNFSGFDHTNIYSVLEKKTLTNVLPKGKEKESR